jgi:hypothetical protein
MNTTPRVLLVASAALAALFVSTPKAWAQG